jgi:D-galactarolactone cycloisomerase
MVAMSKIARVEAFVVSQKLRRSFHFSQLGYDRCAVCLVRVTTDDGRHGWGEGYGPADVVRAGVECFAPHSEDGEPLLTGALWHQVHRRGFDFAEAAE